MIPAYAIAVTIVCALLLVAQCRTWDEREYARRELDDARDLARMYRALHEHEHPRLMAALDRLEELDDDGSEMARVLSMVQGREEMWN